MKTPNRFKHHRHAPFYLEDGRVFVDEASVRRLDDLRRRDKLDDIDTGFVELAIKMQALKPL